MRGDGSRRVFRTCGQVFAASGAQRMQGRGKPSAIESKQREQEARHDVGFASADRWMARSASACAC